MKQQPEAIFPPAYLGPVLYFAHLLKYKHVLIETKEHYVKQTYRNRCTILTANGKQDLIIPVIKVHGNRTAYRDIRISYGEKWQNIHRRAIESAYSHSPYYLFYREELIPFFETKFENLHDLNSSLLVLVLRLIGAETGITYSESFEKNYSSEIRDYRTFFSPKKKLVVNTPEYIQVFSDRLGFIPNLSILDLLFNMGPGTAEYLSKLPLSFPAH